MNIGTTVGLQNLADTTAHSIRLTGTNILTLLHLEAARNMKAGCAKNLFR